VTGIYHVGRRVRFVGATPGTIYGEITVTAFVTDTTVTVAWDSGVLANETITGSYGILSNTNGAIPTVATFPAGTIMAFQQTAAPVGWTKETTHDDKSFRVVTGTASSGGATAFNSVFGSGKITGAEAAHTHTITTGVTNSPDGGSNIATAGAGLLNNVTRNAFYDSHTHSGTTAAGSSHTHTLSLDLQFVDLILAAKD